MNEKYFGTLQNLFRGSKDILVKIEEENLYISNGIIAFKFPIVYKKEILSIFETEYDEIDYELEAFALEEYAEECRDGLDGIEFGIFQRNFDKNSVEEYKKVKAMKELFQDTDFILATDTPIAGINLEFPYDIPIRFPGGRLNITGFSEVFDTEIGLLQVNMEYIEWAFQILRQFSEIKEIKKFFNKRNQFLYIKNNTVEVAIAPKMTIQRQRDIFEKEFLL